MFYPPFLLHHLLLLLLSLLSHFSSPVLSTTETTALMELKASLDPYGQVLGTWTRHGDPCRSDFVGVACDVHGKVTNVSLQGKGLAGTLSPAIAGLRWLTGLYLHFNGLKGEIPREVGNLTELTDLYLDVNDFSGKIPIEIGNMRNLQVLQLCYNKLTGNVPTQLGLLNKLKVLALQSNQLTGAIPATLGDLSQLTRLDLSFNRLFGSIPTKLAEIPFLTVLDLRNNSLSGNVPSGLKRLHGGFQYGNNKGLCGVGFDSLKLCPSTETRNEPNKPEPFGPNSTDLESQSISQSANLSSHCNGPNCPKSSKSASTGIVIIGVLVVLLGCIFFGLFLFLWYRRRKQRIGSSLEISDSRLSTDQSKEVKQRSIINMDYSTNWELKELSDSHQFNLDEVEFATQYFSEMNLLGKSSYSASTYKGLLRDGTVVAVKSISRTCCKQEESDFLKGLKVLALLRHENVVGLKGFCCSSGRGECFLVYDFVGNGSLARYLDLKEGENATVLDWSTRVSIIKGIAKGIEYLHSSRPNKPSLVHQNISAEKILLDPHFVPRLATAGLHKLLAGDVIFSTLKSTAAMGYLAPEYATTGRFTEKSDVYAFGILVFQILAGKRDVVSYLKLSGEMNNGVGDGLVDERLGGNFSNSEAEKLVRIAFVCISEAPSKRPKMESVIEGLN